MTRRITVWLTDEEATRLLAQAVEMTGGPTGASGRASESTLPIYALATAHILRGMGEEIKSTPKGLRKWWKKHEAATRAEYGMKGTETERRVRGFLEEESPLNTQQLRERLGWKQTGSLGQVLAECDWFVEVSAPKDYVRNRGRQPKWWAGSSSIR